MLEKKWYENKTITKGEKKKMVPGFTKNKNGSEINIERLW